MNILTREQQISVISALTEGLGIRAVARITGVNRETVGAELMRIPSDLNSFGYGALKSG